MIPAPRKIEYEDNKLAKRLRRQVGEAIGDFNMIEAGDRVMVCLSGGKDSHALLDILISLKEKSPVRFDLVAVNMDQKQPGFPAHVLPEYLESRGVHPSVAERLIVLGFFDEVIDQLPVPAVAAELRLQVAAKLDRRESE